MNCKKWECVAKFRTKLSWIPPLLARLIIGSVFIESGWGKIHNVAKVTGYFTELGVPMPAFNAYFVAWSEFIFGSLVLLGFLTSLTVIPLIVIMIVAILTAKREDLTDWSALTGFTEFLYIALLVWLGIDGAGCISVDHWLRKKFPS